MDNIGTVGTDPVLALLLGGASRSAVLDYCRERVRPLRSEDARRNSRFEATLRVYLMCGNELVRASQALFIHRNTMVQRIHRINFLLDTDVNLPAVRNEWMNIFAVLAYFEQETAAHTPDRLPAAE